MNLLKKKPNLDSIIQSIIGYSLEEMIGKTPFDFMDTDEAKRVGKVFNEIIAQKKSIKDLENWIIRKDKQRICLLTSGVPVLDKNGELQGYRGVDIDFTERKQADMALISSEHKWRNILVNTPQIGITLNPKAEIIFANKHFLELTGWQRQEVLGQDWFDMFMPEHVKEEMREVFLTVMSQKDTFGFSTYENEILGRSGTLINVAWSNVLTKDAHGNVINVTCLGVDLTERQRSELSLKKSETKYRTIMESMKDAAYICSPELYIEYMNPAMIDWLGTDATGEFCYKAIYDRDEKCSWCVFDQVKKGENVDYEMVNPKDNRNYSVSNSPILHAGSAVSKLTIFHDITEIKNIEIKLRQAQKMEAIGTLSGGIAHDFNNILSGIFGYSQLAQKNIEKPEKVKNYIDQIIEGAKRVYGEYFLRW